MSLFVIYARDIPNSISQRLIFRPAHLARLDALQAAGQLISVGPLLLDADTPPSQGCAGSLFLVDFPSRAALDAWWAEEPFLVNGIYASYEIHPYSQTFPRS